jgi:NTE family protein
VQSLSDGKCRILALRGGGIHGSFEVGVIKAFVNKLDPIDVQYDFISGVSVGAINAAFMALHSKGEEKAGIKELEEFYVNNKPQDYWNFWPYYVYEPLFTKNSVVDNSRFDDIMSWTFGDRPFKRGISMQSVDLRTGQVVIFDETTPMSVRNLAIKSSTAIPIVFPPVEIDDLVLVDGGAFQNINIGDPIERCREELGFEDHDIIVDIVMCMSRPYEMDPWTKEKMTWSNALDFF